MRASASAIALSVALLATSTAMADAGQTDRGLEVIGDVHLRWQGQIVADPEGFGPSVTISAGRRNGWALQLGWAYSSFTDLEHEDYDREQRHRVHYMTVGFTRRTAIDPYSFASVGAGFATTLERTNQLPCDGVLCGPERAPTSDVRVGAWFDARVATDIVRVGPGQAITAGFALQIVAVRPAALAASFGVGYHWR